MQPFLCFHLLDDELLQQNLSRIVLLLEGKRIWETLYNWSKISRRWQLLDVIANLQVQFALDEQRFDEITRMESAIEQAFR